MTPAKLKLFLITLVGTVLFSGASADGFASDCGNGQEFDLTRDPNFQKIPVLNQERTGTCYAQAASTLVNAWRFNSAVPPGDRDFGVLADPYDGSRLVNDYNFNGGHITTVLNAWKSRGFKCDRRVHELPSGTVNDSPPGTNPGSTIEELIAKKEQAEKVVATARHHFEQAQTDYSRLLNRRMGRLSIWFTRNGRNSKKEFQAAEMRLAQARKQVQDIDAQIAATRSAPIRNGFGFLAASNNELPNQCQSQSISTAFDHSNSLNSLVQVFERNQVCQNQSRVRIPDIQIRERFIQDRSLQSRRQNLSSLNGSLEQTEFQYPVGLAFCSNVITQGNINRDCQGNKGNHAVVIVGRSKVDQNGECRFLIRNSWGSGCGKLNLYLRNYASLGASCREETGDFWLPSRLLAKSIVGFVQVK